MRKMARPPLTKLEPPLATPADTHAFPGGATAARIALGAAGVLLLVHAAYTLAVGGNSSFARLIFGVLALGAVVAVVARSDASEWENIIPYDRASAR